MDEHPVDEGGDAPPLMVDETAAEGDLAESPAGTPPPPDADPNESRASEAWAFLKELPFLVVGALIVAVLVKSFLIQVFWIPSGSMKDTLQIGDRVIVNKLAYRIGEPSRGDVVVFEPETLERESLVSKVTRNLLESVGLRTPQSDLIKRIIGLPGDTIELRDNRVYINGAPLDEPYLPPDIRNDDFGPEVVPVGHYFVMGDNRSSSRDSRVFGPIAGDRIVGRAFAVVWPPSRWSGL
jgi:signal peptidase I